MEHCPFSIPRASEGCRKQGIPRFDRWSMYYERASRFGTSKLDVAASATGVERTSSRAGVASVEVQRRLSWRTGSPIWQSLWFITFNYFVLI